MGYYYILWLAWLSRFKIPGGSEALERWLSSIRIFSHVHDELIIECSQDVDYKSICNVMGKSPDWMPDILIRGDGYETKFYKKD